MSRSTVGFTMPKRPTGRPAVPPPSRAPTRKKLPTFVETEDEDSNLSSDPSLPESRSRISTRPLPNPGPRKTVRFQDSTEDLIAEASENSSDIQVDDDDEVPFPRNETTFDSSASRRSDSSSDMSESSEDELPPLKIQDKIYSSRESELPPVAPRFTRPSSPVRPNDRQQVINTLRDNTDSDSDEEIYPRPVQIDDDSDLSRSPEDSLSLEESQRDEEARRLEDTIRDVPPSKPPASRPVVNKSMPKPPPKPVLKTTTSRVNPRDVPPSAPEKSVKKMMTKPAPKIATKSVVKSIAKVTDEPCHDNEVFVEKPEPVHVKCPQSDVIVERPAPVKVKLPSPDVIVEAADPVHIKCPQSDVIMEHADPVVVRSPRSRVTYVDASPPRPAPCSAAVAVVATEIETEVDVEEHITTRGGETSVSTEVDVKTTVVVEEDDIPDKVPRHVKICRSPVSSPTFPRALSPQRPLSPVVKSTTSLCGAPVDHTLRSFGYTPLTKIIIEHTDCRKGKYVKCLDPMGNTVYVKLDIEDGHIAISSTDLVVTKGKVIEQIPRSARRMYRDDQFMCGIGIAIDCKYGICFIVRNRKGHIRECDYHFTYDSCGSKFITDCSLMALPVVSLYEIQCNCSWVINNTDVLMTRLVNMAYRNCLSDVKKYECAMMRLAGATTKFRQIYRESSKKLADSTECHRKYIRDVFARGGPRRDCEGMRKHQLLLYNLQRRHELLVELIHSARVVANLSCQLDSVSKDIEELNGYMCETFQGVDGPMMP